MTEETKIDKKFLINIQGKEFIKFEGLLDIAHKKGLTGIKTLLVSSENGIYIFKAETQFGEKVYTGYGDANKENVSSMVTKHLIRVAETRAIARALRFGCNIGMCSSDELGGDSKPITQKPTTPQKDITTLKCSTCNKPISAKVYEYSKDKYKTPLCFECQKTFTKKKEENPDLTPEAEVVM